MLLTLFIFIMHLPKYFIPASFSIAIIVIVYFLFNPAAVSLFPPCPFYFLTGFYCPGCGSQRAIHQLLHGNIFGAVGYNALLVLSLPVLFLSARMFILNIFKKENRKVDFLYNPQVPKIISGIVLLFWILRNIPVHPFTLLAPHN